MCDDSLTLYLRARAASASCPQCQTRSVQIHSRYTRAAADLPWAGVAVRLVLQVRKFFCRNLACAQRIFAERLPTVVAPRARSSVRLTEVWRLVAFALGGEAGARLLARLRMPTSPDTLLTLIRQTIPVPSPTPRVLGIDDWAIRKVQTYGTILVDLERHHVVDLLPDRTADTVTAWLHAHPGVEIISRDRWDAYATGATKGAPTAVQVADRWHLVTNVGDALERLLTRHTSALRQAARETSGATIDDVLPTPPPAPPPPRPRPPRPRKMPALSAQRVWQLAMYQQVRDLTARGWSRQAIMDELHIDKATVRKYRTLTAFVDGRTTARPSMVEPYRAYIEQRWQEGCTDARQLWRELQAHGFTGQYKPVWVFTRGWPTLPAPPTPPVVWRRHAAYTPRQAMWLLVQPPENLNARATTWRTALCRINGEIAIAYRVAQAFLHLVRTRTSTAFDAWVADATQCGVPELRRFAVGLCQDYAAVRAALVYEHSNGQVEGQVHRLKLVKRSMYGRAKFDLLRLRVLHRG